MPAANPPPGTAIIRWRRPKGTAARHVFWLSERGSLAEAARNLYAVLRRADAGGFRSIQVEPLPAGEAGLAAALADRLKRAAAKR
jgi:L-threonylcarbamoyladenylate synthase